MTGLDYFEARYMSSAQGRFPSPDPMNAGADPTDPQTWNAYGYARNNPLKFVDPYGLWNWNVGNCYYNTVAAYVDGEFQGYDTQFVGCVQPSPNGTSLVNLQTHTSQEQTQAPKLPEAAQIDCSKPPPMPPTPQGANVNTNEAETAGATGANAALGFGWWLNQVRPFGAWDYAHNNGQQYAAFGNVNYGATCNVLGLSLAGCQRGAGAAAYGTAAMNVGKNVVRGRFGGWTAGPGNPIGTPGANNGMPDYGDQATPTENQAVIAGYGYAQWQKACHQ